MHLDGSNEHEYEKFLLSREEGLFYYSIKYKKFLESILNCESDYVLAINDEGGIEGVLPLMFRKGKYGTVVNSLPFYGSNGGILASSEEAFDLLKDYYNDLISRNEIACSNYITNPLADNSKGVKHNLTDKRIGQWTYIGYENSVEERLWESFKSSARRNIRKALKENVEVKIDNKALDFLYKVHHDNISSIGGKPKDKKFFESIPDYFIEGKDYNVYVAFLNGKPISALLLFYYNKVVEYFVPATIHEYRSVQALPLIVYTAMIDANAKGYKWWNWGGTWLSQEGVYRFKKKFGAQDKEYKYMINLNNQRLLECKTDELLSEYSGFYTVPFDRLRG